jgi:hypothetical protein
MAQLGRLLHERRHLEAVAFRHPDVGQDDVGLFGTNALDRLPAVADGADVDVFVGKGQLDHALDRHAVVGKQQLVGHGSRIIGSGVARDYPGAGGGTRGDTAA